MLFVGDPFQSIYGFAGADCNSFYNIKERLNALELPLSINYRCHTKALDLARQIVPHIEARPDAPEGVVEYIKSEDLAEKANEGDLVLCRLTAPLIKECIKMIRHRKPARVRGRDIAKSLTSIIRKVAKANRGEFNLDLLTVWSGKEQEKIQRAKHHEAALEAHNDRIQGIQVCYETFGCLSVNDLCEEIEGLFSDGRASVMLSTIHRAKGLEENRVFIIVPEKLPLTWKGQRDWEFQQEMNLKYVALTRPKSELYFVESEK
jgi:superfamily I DNA/RNA helicase